MVMIRACLSLVVASLIPSTEASESRSTSGDLPSSSPRSGHAYVERASRDKKMRKWNDALADYTRAIQLEPNSVDAHYYRGVLYRDLGNLGQALADLNLVIREDPKWLLAYLTRANIYAKQNEIEKAICDYDKVIREAVHSAEGHFFQARAYDAKRDYAAAAAQYLRARQMSPRDDAILNGMAWMKATCPDKSIRNGREAVEIATRSCEFRKWSDWNSLDTLAAAWAESGNYGQAVKFEKEALRLNQTPPGFETKMQQRLTLYQAQTPFRESDKVR
jgi:tetratricopeptide (TPR) repeat protein